ncbi:MAG TPA: pseudouridine-5'-phosphate glycosidase [Chloroflexi bacterium]|nr:pseudouridine-5'-phosphate glycosidase [Chloroflexota bacterium]
MGWSSEFIQVSPEAANESLPRVALESALISFGLPYPDNIETALAMEEAVRAEGAIPVTIGVIRGRIKVGLDRDEVELLARTRDVHKVSRREIPLLVAGGDNGATTVSGTVFVAGKVGIRVMATGGIGGVHRGNPFDVSADLPTLAETPVAVVCSGAKSILNLEATLEWLETYGVPIIGYGTDEFPAFYTPHSGLKLEYKVQNISELAEAVKAHWELRPSTGLIIAVPVPPGYEMDAQELEEIISQAEREAQDKGVKGKALTPFLLERLAHLSGGRTITANKALLVNNARLAARLAVAL